MRFLKKLQAFSELEAWYHSIIAVDPGNNFETRKINMAEELVDVIVIKTTWEKGSTTETPMPPTSTSQFEKVVLDISNNTDLCWSETTTG